jgi:hypothetical protein
MEIAKAFWQLSYATQRSHAMLIFRDVDFRVLLAFHGLRVMVFVAPFGFGFAAFVSVGTAFAGKASCLPPLPLTRIFLEVFGIRIAVASWIFGNPVQYR